MAMESLKTYVQKCRLCLSENEETISLYEWIQIDGYEQFVNLINKYCEMQISSDDNKPQVICQKCADTSKLFLEFNRILKESDDSLNNDLNMDTFSNRTPSERCRMCLTDEVTTFSLHKKFEEHNDTTFADVVANIFDVQILPYDCKPQLICIKCAISLKAMVKFCRNCKKSNQMLSCESRNGLSKDTEDECNMDNFVEGELEMEKIEIIDVKDELNCTTVKNEQNATPNNSTDLLETEKNGEKSSNFVDLTEDDNFEESKEKVICGTCGRQFPYAWRLKEHLHLHTNKYAYSCETCTSYYETKKTLVLHYRRVHKLNPKIIDQLLKRREELLINEKMDIKEFEGNVLDINGFKIDLTECFQKIEALLNKGKETTERFWVKTNTGTSIEICDICGLFIKSEEELVNHQKNHALVKCDYCEFNWNDRNCYEQHLTQEHPNKGHKCPVCKEIYVKIKNLHKHFHKHKQMYVVHSNEIQFDQRENMSSEENFQSFECDICNKKFLGQENLNAHKLVHTNKQAYICDLCDLGFVNQNVFVGHYKKHHNLNITNASEIGNSVIDLSDSEVHEHSTDSEIEICDVCGFIAENKVELLKHKVKHPVRKCLHCDYKWKTPYDLKEHVTKHHTDKPIITKVRPLIKPKRMYSILKTNVSTDSFQRNNYKCALCPKVFLSQINLQEHMLNHDGNSKVNCGICDQKFTFFINLKMHRETMHPNEIFEQDPFHCDICGMVFVSNEEMKIHKSKHVLSIKKCKFCNFKCKNVYELNYHMTEKHSDKVYPCSICQKVFPEQRNLNIHIRSHNKKPKIRYNSNLRLIQPMLHGCVKCGKTFKSLNSLKYHMNLHVDAFRCERCPKFFPKIIRLQEHYLKDHKFLTIIDEKISEDTITEILKYHKHKRTLEEVRIQIGMNGSEENQFYNNDNSITTTKKNFARICNICGKLILSYEESHFHKCSHLDDLCKLCGYKWFNIKDLNNHMSETHMETSHICNVCKTEYPTESDLQDHMKSHFNGTDIAEDLVEHGTKTHLPIRYACLLCGLNFNNPQILKQHKIKFHAAGKPICTICDFIFVELSALEAHLIAKHHFDSETTARLLKVQKAKIAKINNSVENQSKKLKTHKTEVFNYERYIEEIKMAPYLINNQCLTIIKFKCKVCARVLNNKEKVSEHLKQHVKCFHCDTLFISEMDLYNHINKMHPNYSMPFHTFQSKLPSLGVNKTPKRRDEQIASSSKFKNNLSVGERRSIVILSGEEDALNNIKMEEEQNEECFDINISTTTNMEERVFIEEENNIDQEGTIDEEEEDVAEQVQIFIKEEREDYTGSEMMDFSENEIQPSDYSNLS